jgi:hypothetical protein
MLFRAEATRVGLSSWQNGTIQENDNADTQQIDHKMAGNGCHRKLHCSSCGKLPLTVKQ